MTKVPKEITERLGEFRQTLVGQERTLLRRVASLEDDLRWLDENVETEMVEEGQERSIAGLLQRLDERERAEVLDIEQALERIDRGTYGLCVGCGKPIALERLRALPAAEKCLACTAASSPRPK